MLLYEANVREEFRRTKELAERIREKIRNELEAGEILIDLPLLKQSYELLQRALPEGVGNSGFERHIHFIEYYLKRKSFQGALGNIDDICNFDVPSVEEGFQKWAIEQSHSDSELAKKVGPLLIQRQWDSAVRKGFVILKERMAKTFDADSSLDGRDLVNKVFGKNGFLSGKLDESERESMRNLLDGLFGMFRNTYGHRDIEPKWYEAEAILSMINWSLKTIDNYPGVSPKVIRGKSVKIRT